mgnify:CR=1 FL=1
MIIIRHFLVDSENVNDNWLMLFDMTDEDDEIIVFYTKKSPHMSYMSVIRLIENNKINIRFEECYEGTNALDFQLVSYMGYLMGCGVACSENECDAASAETGADEYIIMSNDTGYDPAIRFWKDKGYPVRRYNVNFCKQAVHKKKSIKYQMVSDIPSKNNTDTIDKDDTNTIGKDDTVTIGNDAIPAEPSGSEKADCSKMHEIITDADLKEIFDGERNSNTAKAEPFTDNLSDNASLPFTDAVPPVLESEKNAYSDKKEAAEVQATMDSIDTSDISEVSTVSDDFDHFEVDSFLNCLGKDNLLKLHETLVHVYGMKQGQTIYKTIKDKSYSFTPEKLTRKKKVERFTGIIFAHSDIDDPGNFVDFLEKNKNKTKNLNGIRAAITKSYGETDGMKYYSLFKPYFKIISALK